jgi:hypothetical protein
LRGYLLCRLLGTFQSTLDEITIIAQPEEEPQDSTAAAAAAARRSVQIKSFYDPAKGVQLSVRMFCVQYQVGCRAMLQLLAALLTSGQNQQQQHCWHALANTETAWMQTAVVCANRPDCAQCITLTFHAKYC